MLVSFFLRTLEHMINRNKFVEKRHFPYKTMKNVSPKFTFSHEIYKKKRIITPFLANLAPMNSNRT